MSSTYNASWAAPTCIGWRTEAANENSGFYALTVTLDLTVGAERTSLGSGLSLYPRFNSPYKTFQVQRRGRLRYTPSHVAATPALAASTGDVWTEWTAWADWTDTGLTYITPARSTSGGTERTLPAVTMTYLLSGDTYDAQEWAIRVRTYDSITDQYGPWAEATGFIRQQPSITAGMKSVGADGNTTVALTTNWERGGRFEGGTIWKTVNGKKVDTYFAVPSADVPLASSSTGAAWSFSVPSCMLPANETRYLRTAHVETADGNSGWKDWLAIAPTSSAGTVSAPTVAWVDGEAVSTVTVTHSTATNVEGYLSWESEDGKTETIQLAFAQSGTAWSAEAEALPYGIAATLSVFVSTASAWKQFDSTHTVANANAVVFSDGAEAIKLPYRSAAPVRTLTPDVETVQLADGSTVARYGLANGRTWKVNADIVNPDTAGSGSAWVAEAVALVEAGHDWWMRTPEGTRARVAVTGAGIEAVKDGTLAKLPLTLTEIIEGTSQTDEDKFEEAVSELEAALGAL